MKAVESRLQRTTRRAKERAEKEGVSLSLVMEDLETLERTALNEGMLHSSASTIKVPIMMAVLEEEGKSLHLTDRVELREENRVSDSVVTQMEEEAFTIHEYLQWMIIESCNASTNVLIDIVGFERVNQIFSDLGMEGTRLRRKMVDLEARAAGRDNVISAKDMAILLKALYRKEYFREDICEKAMDLMKRCRASDLLLRFVPQKLDFAHKTGGLEEVSHDVGLFLGEKNYLVCALTTSEVVKEGDPVRSRLIGQIGRWLFEEEA